MVPNKPDISIECLFLGNELLIGRTTNTNLVWLGKEISRRGLEIFRTTTCRDREFEIIITIKEILSRKPKFLIITGGLGPTFDDIQLECLAKAINEPLLQMEEALLHIKSKYEKFGLLLTEERKKMALLPKGAKPLSNSVGTAPGSLYNYMGSTHIISLPGVPKEMKAIMNDHIFKIMEGEVAKLGLKMFELGFDLLNVPESSLAPLLSVYTKKYPQLTFKSHPLGEEGKSKISLHVYTISKTQEILNEAIMKLKKQVVEEFPDAQTTEIQPVLFN